MTRRGESLSRARAPAQGRALAARGRVRARRRAARRNAPCVPRECRESGAAGRAGRAALRGLVLEAAKGHELALRLDDTLHRRRAEGTDQLILQIGIAGIEALGSVAGARGDAGAREAAPHVRQLGDVAQPGQPNTQSERTSACTKRCTFVAPPIGTTTMPSASKSRPRRRASASSAAWSLQPSTRSPHAPRGTHQRRAASGSSGGRGPRVRGVVFTGFATVPATAVPEISPESARCSESRGGRSMSRTPRRGASLPRLPDRRGRDEPLRPLRQETRKAPGLQLASTRRLRQWSGWQEGAIQR
jgi:hypothetical protein